MTDNPCEETCHALLMQKDINRQLRESFSDGFSKSIMAPSATRVRELEDALYAAINTLDALNDAARRGAVSRDMVLAETAACATVLRNARRA